MNVNARRTGTIIVFELAIVLGASAVFLGPHTISLSSQLVIMGALIAFVNIQFISRLKHSSLAWARAAAALKWLLMLGFVSASIWLIWRLMQHKP
jgi:hypothetical protein